MSSPTDTPTRPKRGNGITTPSRRGGSGRVLTDVIVDLGFVDRGTMDLAIERGTENGSAPERVLVQDGTLTDDQLARAVAERFGLDHIDLGLYRVDPDAAKLVAPAAVRRYQAVPGLLHRRPHAARRDGRPRQRARDRRHRGHDRLRGAPGGVVAGRRRAAARAPRGPGLRPRRRRARRGGRRRRRRRRRAAPRRSPPPRSTTCARTPRSTSAPAARTRRVIQLVHRVIKEAVERGASDIHFEPGEDEMRVRYRIDGVLQEAATVPVSAVPAVISPHQDPLRPRHRRAPHPAGRPHLARGRRQADRPPRRHAPRAVRREGRHANPRPEQGHDPARAAGHAPAGARAVHEGVRPGPRRRARHRPDRLRQVDVALRRAEPAQHDREAHHHDRGPGRVPARRASRRSRSTTRRA